MFDSVVSFKFDPHNNHDKIGVTAIFSCLKVGAFQSYIKPFDIQNCPIRHTIGFSARSNKQEWTFTMQYHECFISIEIGDRR